jgi:hypothetical protein
MCGLAMCLRRIRVYCPAYEGASAQFNPVDACQGVPADARLKWHSESIHLRSSHMKAIVDLFSTDYGLFSISGILFMIGMAIWFYRFFNRKMEESERAQKHKM